MAGIIQVIPGFFKKISSFRRAFPGACFRVDKIIGSAHPYAITLYWDSKGKKLYYGALVISIPQSNKVLLIGPMYLVFCFCF